MALHWTWWNILKYYTSPLHPDVLIQNSEPIYKADLDDDTRRLQEDTNHPVKQEWLGKEDDVIHVQSTLWQCRVIIRNICMFISSN